MNGKLPSDAFAEYVAAGDERSYQLVADRHGVSKQAVCKRAVAEDWAGRLAKIEQQARDTLDKKLAETIEGMAERHLKMMRVVQHKALAALTTHPIESAMDAVRAMDLAVKHERLIRGEPTERQAVAVEDVIKREYDRWMRRGGAGDPDDEEDDDEPGDGGSAGEPGPPGSLTRDRSGAGDDDADDPDADLDDVEDDEDDDDAEQ